MFLLRAIALPLVASVGFPGCINGPLASNLVCDPTAPIAARAEALVKEFTVLELVANLGNRNPGFGRFRLPEYDWANEALVGLWFCARERRLADDGCLAWTGERIGDEVPACGTEL